MNNKNGLNTKQTEFLIEKITTGVFTASIAGICCRNLSCGACELLDTFEYECGMTEDDDMQFIAEHFPEVLL